MKIITVENVDLIYRTNESISAKKIFNLITKKDNTIIKNYKALNNISFSMELGKVYGIIGDNGAGKSTLLRVLAGVYSPNKGKVDRKTQSISLLALGTGFSKDLSGRENIFLNAMLLGFKRKFINSKIDEIIEFSELGEFIDRPMKTYSSGMVSRLGFSIAIHMKPDVLLIDEILSVGDISFKEKSFNEIKKVIGDENITVAIVSHSANQIKELCDEAIWLDKGKLVEMGPSGEIIDKYLNYKTKNKEEGTEIFVDIQNHEIDIDLSNYKLKINGDCHSFINNVSDYTENIFLSEMNVKITKRSINNEDYLLFFEIENPIESNISIIIDELVSKMEFSQYYEKPDYDNRYGENILTGPMFYLDLKKGSLINSKLYYFNKLEKTYETGKSELFHLIEENQNIELSGNRINCSINNLAEQLSFFILVSKEKLFKNTSNIENYFKHYFNGIKNNIVLNSFFIKPEGTYTKLPHSIEPYTPSGYGFNLHHSSKRDLTPFLKNTNERYFYDMILSNMAGIFLYQKKKNGIFYTLYTSTWLKKDSGITAPYIDTRLNETYNTALLDLAKNFPEIDIPDIIKNFVYYLADYKNTSNHLYKSDNGILFPDYFKDGLKNKTHASLNHQLGIANLCFRLYIATHNLKCLELFTLIINFISDTYYKWINPENDDLFYGIKEDNNQFVFFGEDYVYVTLMDLIYANINYFRKFGKRNEFLDKLIYSKIKYLDKSGYSIFSDNTKIVSGEHIDSRERTLKLYKKLEQLN